MARICKALVEEAFIIHQLAHQIYFPTYRGILTGSQMEFMLKKSYTEEALKQSMIAGQDFYLLYEENVAVGFMALMQKKDVLRIEKLYLLPETQGKGYGKNLISLAEEQARICNKFVLELNVNRGNKAYYFYLKQEFEVIAEVDIPYYGYILDDYVMQKKIAE